MIRKSKCSLFILALLPFAITFSPTPKFSPANAVVLTCESNLENGNFPVNQTTLSRLQQARIAGVDKLWSKGFDGAGQTIAVLGSSNFKLSDIDSFAACNNITPRLTIKVVGTARPFESVTEKASVEWLMDIQTAMSLAPGADIIFYKGKDIFEALEAVGNENIADIVTSSFGTTPSCEALDNGGVTYNRFNSLYKKLAQQGQTMLRGMGDMGTLACAQIGSNPPDNLTPSIVSGSGSPWVTPLSGLTISQVDPLIATPWNSTSRGMGGGSGISIFEPRPAWQNAPGFDPTITNRFSPDFVVQSVGTIFYKDGKWGQVDGVSMAGPLMSGVLATIAQSCSNGNANYRLGWLNPAIYAMAQDKLGFTDITTGKNMSFGYGGFNAKVGHDLASGLGTIDPKTFPTELCKYIERTPRNSYLNSAAVVPPTTQPAAVVPPTTQPAATSSKSKITCIKGKITKIVVAANPKCPLGYKKKQ